MTANEIRAMKSYNGTPGEAQIAEWLQEIAAQLAELNQRITHVTEGGSDFGSISIVSREAE